MAKADRIVTRLESEVRARLHAKASALGLDDAAYVRTLIYRDLNELAAPVAMRRGTIRPAFASGEIPVERVFVRGDGTAEEPEPLPAEEMDIPADADGGDPGALDELLGASSTILDEMMAMAQPAPQAPAAPAPRSYHAPLSRRPGAQSLQPVYGPGSKTRAVGVNDMAIGGNTYGDGRGNVLRENMRHFGIVGTRSR